MQHRRKFLIQGSLALGAAALMKPLKGFSMEHSFRGLKGSQTLTILHTSDLHINDYITDDVVGLNLKSIERSLTAIKKNSPNTVLLHNGNFTESSTAYSEKHLEKLKALEVMGYDAIVLG
jgi:2',3'-cyclic-nucleotide 2'-phosphodiesterase (5'-nucleotidase family)